MRVCACVCVCQMCEGVYSGTINGRTEYTLPDGTAVRNPNVPLPCNNKPLNHKPYAGTAAWPPTAERWRVVPRCRSDPAESGTAGSAGLSMQDKQHRELRCRVADGCGAGPAKGSSATNWLPPQLRFSALLVTYLLSPLLLSPPPLSSLLLSLRLLLAPRVYLRIGSTSSIPSSSLHSETPARTDRCSATH